MSRVYFHSPSGEAVLRGSERAWCGVMIDDIGRGVLGEFAPFGDGVARLQQLIRPDHYLAKELPVPGTPGWWQSFKLAVSSSFGGSVLTWKGEELGSFSFVLNTALLLGNDTVKLMAYLHGQCEIHGWIAGEDRKWYADLIADGRESGLLRAEQGWEDVRTLLLKTRDEPVVTSYSVSESFPNPYLAGLIPETPPPDYDPDVGYDALYAKWENLSAKEQWDKAFLGVVKREKPNASYRWSPQVFAEQKFGHELSFLDLLAPDVIDRIERALA